MEYRPLGKTGIQVSAVSYGGIVSAGFYEGVSYPAMRQQAGKGTKIKGAGTGSSYCTVFVSRITEGCFLYVSRLTATRAMAQAMVPGTAAPKPKG